jgi:hypothetical protein
MKRIYALLMAAYVIFASAFLSAQTPYMVKDIAPGSTWCTPGSLTDANSTLFFNGPGLNNAVTGLDNTLQNEFHFDDLACPYKAYPNPFNATLEITTAVVNTNGAYTITNALGQQVMSGGLQGLHTTLHTEELPAGIYMLCAGAQSARKTVRIIKY